MALTPPTFEDLESFSGEQIAALYTDDVYAVQVLQQAADLFYFATALDTLPDPTTPEGRLARYGILEMAQALYLGQRYKGVVANPFGSETIGNYSYSKAQRSLDSGVPTGLSWFDQAVRYFSENVVVESTSVTVFENDDTWLVQDPNDQDVSHKRVLGPRDLKPDVYGIIGWPGGPQGQRPFG